MQINNVCRCTAYLFSFTALLEMWSYVKFLIYKIFSLDDHLSDLDYIQSKCLYLLNLLIDRRSEAIRKGQRQTVCRGVRASWHLKVGLGASLSDSAKKMSRLHAAFHHCAQTPVREVRERDMGQFWESIVDISSEYEYLTWAIHVPHCLQTTGLPGWVILPQLMARWWHQNLLLTCKTFNLQVLQ